MMHKYSALRKYVTPFLIFILFFLHIYFSCVLNDDFRLRKKRLSRPAWSHVSDKVKQAKRSQEIQEQPKNKVSIILKISELFCLYLCMFVLTSA